MSQKKPRADIRASALRKLAAGLWVAAAEPLYHPNGGDQEVLPAANYRNGSDSAIDLKKTEVGHNFHAGTSIETLFYY